MSTSRKFLFHSMILLSSLSLMYFFVACSVDAHKENNLTLQRKSLATAEGLTRLEAYSKLSPIEKKELWLSKLDQSLNIQRTA
jgi:hypothetical protein